MNSAMWRIILSLPALGLTSGCFHGLFKVAAKVVAAISFPLSAGLPIDSHLKYHSADSSKSPCPFVKPTNKSRSFCLARNKLVLIDPYEVGLAVHFCNL
jgi:hypothetical protein